MFFFFVTHKNAWKRVLLIIIFAFFTAWLLFIQNQTNNSAFSTKEGPKVIYKGDVTKKNIALTFNVAWGDELIIPILDTLQDNKIKNATFFISGSWAEMHPDIIKRIVQDGHEIGSLGYAYKSYTGLSDNEVSNDITKANEVFTKLGVKGVKLLRPPNGDFNKTILAIAERLNYTIVHWSNNSNDINSPGIEAITQNVTSNLHGGDIILFNASDAALQTKKSIPVIVKYINNKGFTNVTVSELIANATTIRKTLN